MPPLLNLSDLGRRVRAARLTHRLTLEEVVSRTGFTVSWLSKLENGQLTPSLDGLFKLSQALECGVDELVEGLSVPPQFVVVKQGGGVVGNKNPGGKAAGSSNGKPAGKNGKGVVAESLADQWRGRQMQPVILHLSGAGTANQPESHEGERFLLVLQGSVKVSYGDEQILLDSGDSIYLDATIPHGLAPHCRGTGGRGTDGRGTARVLSVSYRPGTNARGSAPRLRSPVFQSPASKARPPKR
jgi:quercetin dioxygenase-like cupin family protein/DNA-binding Xre family transcriptional regulator